MPDFLPQQRHIARFSDGQALQIHKIHDVDIHITRRFGAAYFAIPGILGIRCIKYLLAPAAVHPERIGMGEMRISPEPSRMLVVGYVPDKATPEAVTELSLIHI